MRATKVHYRGAEGIYQSDRRRHDDIVGLPSTPIQSISSGRVRTGVDGFIPYQETKPISSGNF